jgi:hypothetical protein
VITFDETEGSVQQRRNMFKLGMRLGYSSDDVGGARPHALLVGWEQNLILNCT